eukprot:2010688-Prymnesium_polylepis.1
MPATSLRPFHCCSAPCLSTPAPVAAATTLAAGAMGLPRAESSRRDFRLRPRRRTATVEGGGCSSC